MTDTRPAVWVGHIHFETDRLDESEAFMKKIGMRSLFRFDDVAILELRGGTHLVLRRKDTITPSEASFDLMVDDLEKTHREFSEMGLEPSAVETGRIHQRFRLQDPSGNLITFNSTHVSDQPV